MLKKIIKQILPKKLISLIQKKKVRHFNNIEIKNYFKDNLVIKKSKMKFFIITDSCEGVGPLSGWFHYMTLVNFALSNNYIPILDFKNTYMPVFMDNPQDKTINYWNKYFTQPNTDFTLNEAYNSTHIVVDYFKLSKNNPTVFSYLAKYSIFKNSNSDYLSSITKKDLFLGHKLARLCPINIELVKKAEEFYIKNTSPNQKILGVSFIRCYERLHLVGSKWTPPGTHPVKCSLNQLPKHIDDALLKTGAEKFLFVVDDRESYDYISNIYGSRCFSYPRPLRHLFENGVVVNDTDEKKVQALLNVEFSELKKPIEQRNSDYLIEVYLLSLCDSLLSLGGSSDTFAYILKNGKYENIL